VAADAFELTQTCIFVKLHNQGDCHPRTPPYRASGNAGAESSR
jgi:hypothetical protein